MNYYLESNKYYQSLSESRKELIKVIDETVYIDCSENTCRQDSLILEEEMLGYASALLSIQRQEVNQATETLRDIIKQRQSSKGRFIYPLLLRKAVYFLTFTELVLDFNEAKVLNKNNSADVVKGSANGVRTGIQSKVIKDLGLTRKVYQRWNIHPVKDFLDSLYKPASLVELKRNGVKRNELLYIITKLINSTYYDNFIDVFGGTGAVTAAGYPKRFETLNELGDYEYNFLACCKENARKVVEESFDIYNHIYDIIQNKKYNDKLLEFILEFEDFAVAEYEKMKSNNLLGSNNDFYLAAVYYLLLANVKGMNLDGTSKYKNLDEAAITAWLQFICGYKITGIGVKRFNYSQANLSTVPLIQFGKRLKSVEITKRDFLAVLHDADKYWGTKGRYWDTKEKAEKQCPDKRSIVKSPENTIVYLDPPYFQTVGYTVVFSEQDHINMLDWMRNTECKWVFSCKSQETNKSKTASKNRILKSFKGYFEYLMKDKEYYVYKPKRIKKDNEDNEIVVTNFRMHNIGVLDMNSYVDWFWYTDSRLKPAFVPKEKEDERKELAKKNHKDNTSLVDILTPAEFLKSFDKKSEPCT